MTLIYQSTRDENNKVTASQAILQGLATDGGLFTPTSLPEVALVQRLPLKIWLCQSYHTF